MPISRIFSAGSLTVVAASFCMNAATIAYADDGPIATVPVLSISDKTGENSPWAVFKFGYSAYKKGDKEKAVEAYRFAADKGLPGARWKLAQMYASGDGVQKDDYAAFQMFSDVINTGALAGSQDETYVADAHVALARYLISGIPGTAVAPNPLLARDLYMRAATYYGNSDAQFELGRMILASDHNAAGVKQAAKWLRLAVHEGHAGAEAELGDLYFQSGRIVRGLAMLTAALRNASPKDRGWIQSKQEQAFALSSEADRRTAIALAESGKALD